MNSISSTERILSEDILKHIYSCQQKGHRPTLESIAGAVQVSVDQVSTLITKMGAHNLLTLDSSEIHLTPTGEEYALQIIRAHRLWERYLADETGFDESEWHNQADRHEHDLSPAEVDALAARLGHPTHDPHGDPIPSAKGHFVPHGGRSLTTLKPGDSAKIVHLEDEPPIVFAQLVAEGLFPDMEIRLTEITPQRVCFWADGKEHILAPIVAGNISVLPLEQAVEIEEHKHLSDLKIGESGRVVNISPACRGVERRRFMDLGILPGTIIKAEMVSPGGDPTAYLVRHSLIGLRKEQADYIHITTNGESQK